MTASEFRPGRRSRVGVVGLVWSLHRVQLMNELQYRGNLLLHLFGTLLATGTSLALLTIVFSHVRELSGWTEPQLLALVGVFTLVGGLLRTFVWPNLVELVGDVHEGTLEYLMLKPRDTQLLVSIRAVKLWQLTDVVMGGMVIGWAVSQFEHGPGPLDVLLFVSSIILGVSIIYSFLLTLMTTCFWFIQVEEIAELFETLYQAGRWPTSAYPSWMRLVLTFVVPVGSALTVSAEAIIARMSWWSLVVEVALAVGFFVLARRYFTFGLRHYTGASG